jgi:hypothetical protein
MLDPICSLKNKEIQTDKLLWKYCNIVDTETIWAGQIRIRNRI